MNQEAVCGTCGGGPFATCEHHPGVVVHALGFTGGFCRHSHRYIPAPVVPSDDERPTLVYLASPYSDPDPAVMERRFEAVCREAAVLMARGIHIYSPIAHTHPIAVRGDLPKDWTFWEAYDRVMLGASSELWVLTLDGYEGSRGVAAEVNIATEMGKPVRYIAPEAAASPTPSQDAESVRNDSDRQLVAARIEAVSAAISSAVEDVQPNIPMIVGEAFNAGVSAIREPCEALVKRGRAVLDDQQAEYECGFCSGSNADHEDECVIPTFAATLTHIEKSLGGRKDGSV